MLALADIVSSAPGFSPFRLSSLSSQFNLSEHLHYKTTNSTFATYKMLRTKSLRITTVLEERKDDVPPLPTWEPPRTAPPRTSLALGVNGPPSSTASEFGFASQAYLSALITPSPRSISPGRGRSWTKTFNFFKSARRKQNPTSTPNNDDVLFEGISGPGGLARWSIEEKVGYGYPLGHSAVRLFTIYRVEYSRSSDEDGFVGFHVESPSNSGPKRRI